MSAHVSHAAFAEGKYAYACGLTAKQCPFPLSYDPEVRLRRDNWLAGWHTAAAFCGATKRDKRRLKQ